MDCGGGPFRDKFEAEGLLIQNQQAEREREVGFLLFYTYKVGILFRGTRVRFLREGIFPFAAEQRAPKCRNAKRGSVFIGENTWLPGTHKRNYVHHFFPSVYPHR